MKIEEQIARRIRLENQEEVTGLDLTIATILADLNKQADKKKMFLPGIAELGFSKTVEIQTENGTFILILATEKDLALWRKCHQNVILTLEERLPEKKIIVLSKKLPGKNSHNINIRSKEQKSFIQDLVFPLELVGRRVRFTTAGDQVFINFVIGDSEKVIQKIPILEELALKLSGQKTKIILDNNSEFCFSGY